MTVASLGDDNRSVKILSLGYVVAVIECTHSYVKLCVPATHHIDVLRGRGKRLTHAWVASTPFMAILVRYILDGHTSIGRQCYQVPLRTVSQLEKVFPSRPLFHINDTWKVHGGSLPIRILKVEGFLARRLVKVLLIEWVTLLVVF